MTSEKVTPAAAKAMRKILRAHKDVTGFSDYVLACDITAQTGTEMQEESIRRFMAGISTPRQTRLRAIRTYLEFHNPHTAHRARLTRLALMLAEDYRRS